MKFITATTLYIKIIGLLERIALTRQSITGVTYMDHFNFEERYTNVNECDPVYYYPLHLPHHCAKLFEKLIRSRVAAVANAPVKIVRERYSYPPKYDEFFNWDKGYSTFGSEFYGLSHNGPNFGTLYDEPAYVSAERYEDALQYLPPYQKMLELVRRDVYNNPTAPVVGLSNSGPVAFYEQPISRHSEHFIKKIAQMYADAGRKPAENDNGYYYGKIEIPSDAKKPINKAELLKMLKGSITKTANGGKISKKQIEKLKRNRPKNEGLEIAF